MQLDNSCIILAKKITVASTRILTVAITTMDTWLLEFCINFEDVQKNFKDFVEDIVEIVGNTNPECQLAHMHHGKNLCAFFTDCKGVSMLLQGTEGGVLTADINNSNVDNLDFEKSVRKLESALRQMEFSRKRKTADYRSLPKIRRGREFSCYDHVSGHLVERDFDRVVFDEVTPFQHIRILHSRQYGNCMYVDNDLNISESDYEQYTHAMTGFGLADFAEKNVLVLGGGDGGVLRHLKDKGPSMITVVDIDIRIIEVAKAHLQKICHDALDSLEGKNYKVIIDDAVDYLAMCAQNGQKYDYVINEINTLPVTEMSLGSNWNFMWKVLTLSMGALKHDGMYFAHGTSELCQEALTRFEDRLKDLDCDVEFKKKVACLPSYLENWVFYAIWKDVRNNQT